MSRSTTKYFGRDNIHNNWPVAYFTLAEHRYRWDAPVTFPKTYDEFKAQVPYKVDDVVLIEDDNERGYSKALIVTVITERNSYGERREKYRVVYETKKGSWSKNWHYRYPGQIQRAYQKAGLAPEMPV